MPIPVQCPACQHAFAVAEQYLGKRGKCPKCGLIFKAEAVPDDEEVATFPEVPLTSEAPQVPVPKRLAALTAKTPPPIAPTPPPLIKSDGPPPPGPPPPPLVPIEAPVVPQVELVRPMPVLITERPDLNKRAKPRSLVSLILLAFGGGTALAVTAVLALIFLSQGEDPAVDPDNKPGQNKVAVEEAPLAPLLTIDSLLPLRDGVLLIDITTPQGRQQASCFVLDDDGHVATSWRAVAQATKVEAIGPIGVRIPIPGAVAIDVPHDLVVLKLKPRVPLDFNTFALAETPPVANLPVGGFELAATEDTEEVRAGRISAVTKLADLPRAARLVLKSGLMPWQDDTLTIVHDMPLPTSSAGSPLVDDKGNVVAVQAMNDAATGNLAVSVRHLAPLLQNLSAELKPWPIAADLAYQAPPPTTTEEESPAVVASDEQEPEKMPPAMEEKVAEGKEPEDENDIPKLPVVPGDDEIVENLLPFPKNDPVDNTLAHIAEQLVECAKLNWRPTNAREYAHFQILAANITKAASIADAKDDSVPANVKAHLAKMAAEALQSLPADEFPSDEAWEEINKLAVAGLAIPGEGIFALGRVTIPASDGNILDDKIAAVLELVGTKQLIALTIAKDTAKFSTDAKILIVGIHDPKTTVRVNDTNVAAMVECKFALLVGKAK